MQTLKFLLGMVVGSTIGYCSMVLKDKKISFNVTVTDYDDEDDYDFGGECELNCECGNCLCADDCEPVDWDDYDDDYEIAGEVFDENGEPIVEDDSDVVIF